MEMILSLIIFFILILLIYSLSRRLTSRLYHLLSLELLSFFLLPGTVVHELSHMIVAEVLFVKTSRFDFKPQITEGNEVAIGRLEVTQTDPFRRTLIGLAPLISGLAIIGFGFQLTMKQFNNEAINHLTIYQFLILFALGYLLFAISVTMFSSRQDLEAVAVPALLLTIFIFFFYLAGFKLTVPKNVLDFLARLLGNLNRPLGFVVILDLAAFFVLKGLNLLIKPH